MRLNPDIFKFTIDNSFIYQPSKLQNFFNKLQYCNILNPTVDEIKYVTEKISSFTDNSLQNQIYILP